MPNDDVILKFNAVSFGYGHNHPILNEASFSMRRGMKVALMGQNGAGKSTIFSMITGDHKPEGGTITLEKGMGIAIAKQIIQPDELDLTVQEFFEKQFDKKVYDIEPRAKKMLDVVHLVTTLEKKVRALSGGQQARLLLASALIQEPDLLLLDEPTNNLDHAGLEHLTQFLKDYKKTCIVISHDSAFLNAFTHGVLYLDIFTRKLEQYAGDYHTVVSEIAARIERERRKNVRLEKDIEHRKEQANFFAQKGGHMRDVARKMREKIEELDEEKVETRQEDKTIRNFRIPCQADLTGPIITLDSLTLLKGGKPVKKSVEVSLKRKEHLLLSGPNGIGKTTLLEAIANGKATGASIQPGVRVGYYRQDFSTLNMNETVHRAIAEVMNEGTEQELRSVASGFLLNADILKKRVGDLSEGQKGLVMFARLVLQKPGLLILDEPTNHINFRHVPVIATALDQYEGAMILVSHVADFVKKIRIDQTLDLKSLL